MAEVLILGGGLAGGAAALLLARAGRAVHLIERETGPHHKVCGEFLSIEAHRHLDDLGLDPLTLGATPIERVRLISGKAIVEAPLPFAALGLSRWVLDEALLARATTAGATIERGVRVLGIAADHARTSAGPRGGEHIMLATGKLPVREDVGEGGKARQDARDHPYVGFKMHYRLSPPARARLRGVVQLLLFDGGYAGLQPVEDGRANLCLIIRRERLAGLDQGWAGIERMLASLPHGGPLLADAEPLLPRPVTIANLAYGPPPKAKRHDPLFRLGDQAGMTASLTGDGMALALRSAFLAAQCLGEGLGAEHYRHRHRAETHAQIARAMALQQALEARLPRAIGMGLLHLWPALLTQAARATRLPEWRSDYCPGPGRIA